MMSLIAVLNRVGLISKPCGTPLLRIRRREVVINFNLKDLLVRKFLINICNLLLKFSSSSFSKILYLQVRSNTLEQSEINLMLYYGKHSCEMTEKKNPFA